MANPICCTNLTEPHFHKQRDSELLVQSGGQSTKLVLYGYQSDRNRQSKQTKYCIAPLLSGIVPDASPSKPTMSATKV
ncbi:hypothetical protein TSMEX_006833 [Taenia solium]|eukprot:TsM_001092600 transcript=TsM_001092600 gene=TsM_001092600